MTSSSNIVDFSVPVGFVPSTDSIISSLPSHSPAEKRALIAEIKAELKRQDADLVAHYYPDSELQKIA